MKNKLLLSSAGKAPEGQIHFIASTNFSNVNFFQNITNANSGYDFSNLKVYINGELTNQSASSISANTNDDVIIKATSGKYPWFGGSILSGRIESIEEPLPLMHQADGNPVTSLRSCFYNCYSLTSIPEGLFDNNPQVTSFMTCFYNCNSLTSIPQGLFDNNTQVTDFSDCFTRCNSLTSIPEGLFDNSPQVARFDSCFYNCASLTSIPAGLFDNNPQVTRFNDCFSYCSSLTSIPAGLFDNNPQVTSFSYCFSDCINLTSIPQGLFDKNVQVTDFYGCFNYCDNLTVVVQIGSTASSVNVAYFADGTKEKGTVYCRAGSAAYNAFAETSNANVNVLTY